MKGNYVDISIIKTIKDEGTELFAIVTPFNEDKNGSIEPVGTTYNTSDVEQLAEWLVEIGKDNKKVCLRASESKEEETFYRCEGDEM